VIDKKIHEARAFNFTYRYIGDVLSINNPKHAGEAGILLHIFGKLMILKLK
jgi:hypothetical protein